MPSVAPGSLRLHLARRCARPLPAACRHWCRTAPASARPPSCAALRQAQRIVGIGLVAVEEMLGVEHRLALCARRPRRWSRAILSRFSSRGMPSATSTWKSQVLPTRQTASARCASSTGARPGSLAALRPGRLVMPKAVKLGVLQRGRLGEEGGVGRVGAGPAALDIVDAERVQRLRDLALVLAREKSTPCVCAPSRSVVSKR